MGKVLQLDYQVLVSLGGVDPRAVAIFQPHTILGTQWHSPTAISGASPELRFWIAFFLLAIQDAEPLEGEKIQGRKGPERKKVVDLSKFASYNKRQWARWQRDARAYIGREEDGRGSFRWLCDVLGFDVGKVREALEVRWESGKRTQLYSTLKADSMRGQPMKVGTAVGSVG